jgi:hypothetical protein
MIRISKDSDCSGKHRFDSMPQAQKVAKRMRRRKKGERFKCYHCAWCKGFHIGGVR